MAAPPIHQSRDRQGAEGCS